jgi:sulfur relay (sulfurtransferase) DsrC/TusE family protein
MFRTGKANKDLPKSQEPKMTSMTKIDVFAEERVKTAELFDAYLESNKRWSPKKVEIANVFKAFVTAAWTAEHISKVIAAVHSHEEVDVSPELTALVKAKVLRSRLSNGGSRLYEVNY